MKHPVLTNSVRLIVWWLAWLFITSCQLLLYYYAFGRFTTAAIPDGIVSLVIYSGIGLSLWYPFRYFRMSSGRTLSVITNIIISGVISVAFWVLVTKYFTQAIMPNNIDYQAYWEATLPFRVGTGVFIYG